jgi:hypothetical protein
VSVSAPARFSLRVPETWFEFDVWRATRTGDLSRMVDRRLEDLPELRPHRSAILRGLRQLAEDAERRGAVYCAAAADRVDDDGTMLATLMVFSTEGMPEPGLNTVEAIAAQITTAPRSDSSPDWREVAVVDLAAGRAVRVRGVSTTTSPDGTQALSVVSMHTLIPIPGADGVLNVVLTSPQLSLSDGLLDLFDAISATLSWEDGPSPR